MGDNKDNAPSSDRFQNKLKDALQDFADGSASKRSSISTDSSSVVTLRSSKDGGDQEFEIGVPDDGTSVIELKKSLNLVSSSSIIVGSMIGSGIFISPTGVLKDVGSLGASTVIFVISGLFSLCGALCYAELGTMIPKSGGDYAYVLEAFGKPVGFMRLWSEVIIIRPASIAAILMVAAQYALYPIYYNCIPQVTARVLAGIFICIIGFANCCSVRLAIIIQDVCTYGKVLALILIIATGVVQMARGFTSELEVMFDNTIWELGAIANGFYITLFAYSGWHYLNCVLPEMKNIKRDLPIAVVVSCLLVTVLYTFTNIAYATVISVREMLESDAVAVTFGMRIYGVMWWIIPILVTCSTFGSANGTILTTSRMFYAGSQEGQMPPVLSFLHYRRMAPTPAVIFTCFFALLYLMFDDVFTLIMYTGFVQCFVIALCVFIVIVFRFTRKEIDRPIKVPIVLPFIFVLLTACLTIFAFVGAPFESFMGVLMILSGFVVYLFCFVLKKPKWLNTWIHQATIATQKILFVVGSK